MVHLNGTNVINETHSNNQTLILATYPVCSCASHSISVRAVNRCGRVGQSTPSITLNPEPLPEPVYMCDDDDGLTTKPTDHDDAADDTIDDGGDKGQYCKYLIR